MALTDGLVLQLEGPTGLVDQSPVGVTGQTYNGGMGTVDSDGRLAFSFDGTNDFIELGAFDAGISSLSISKWLNWDGTTTWSPFVSCRSGVNVDFGFWLGNDGGLDFQYVNAASVITANVGDGTYEDGEWHHFAINVTPTQAQCFVNGVAMATTSLAFLEPIGRNLRIGNNNVTGYGKGLLDSIRIYNRVLTNNEIAVLASARGAGSGGSLLLGRRVVDSVFHNPIQPVIF